MSATTFYPCSRKPSQHRDGTTHRATAAVVFRGEDDMISHYLCTEHTRCSGIHEQPTNGQMFDASGKAWCTACADALPGSADNPSSPDIVPIDSPRFRQLAFRPQSRELDAISAMCAELNKINTLPGTRWIVVPKGLTETAKQDGKLARVQLLLLTDHAAERAGLIE